MIEIIDYGAGNLLSVKKAFDFLKVESKVISSVDEFNGFDRIVLPGGIGIGAEPTEATRRIIQASTPLSTDG